MRIGDILNGTYQIERPLGAGGQARVWQARHLRLPRTFAIKECPLTGDDPRERAARRALFVRERDILAALSYPGHPAIPKVSDFWEEPDELFLVMDLVEGVTLIELLSRRARVSMPEAINWGIQLCDVLTYLHSWQPPIIYRDLSPDNVILDRAGQLHLIDFGIARTLKPGQLQNTTSLGKASYASPEHLDGGKSQTDVRSDIYTLGALLYHLLTGQEPMPVVERLKHRARLQGGRALIAPRALDPQLLPALEDCVLRAMELEPTQRFQNAKEMERALASCAMLAQQAALAERNRIRTRPIDPTTLWGAATAPAATPPSLPSHPQTPHPWPQEPPAPPASSSSRRPITGSQATSGEASPMSGALGPSPLRRITTGPGVPHPGSGLSGPLPEHPDTPTRPTPVTSPGRPIRPLSDAPSRIVGGMPAPGLSVPSGATNPRIPAQPTGSSPAEYANTARGASGPLPPIGGQPLLPVPGERGPLLSRRRLLIGIAALGVAATGAGVAVALLNNRPRLPYTVLLTLTYDVLPVRAVAWSPDARSLAGGGDSDLVKIWDARSGALVTTLRGHSDFVQGIAWSPDGSRLASASASSDKTVRVWDALQGGAAQLVLTGHTDTVYSVAWSPDGTLLASASADGSVRIWDAVHGGDAQLVLTGHTADVYAVAWSPDGSLIASGSKDGTTKLWNPRQAGGPRASLDNQTGPVSGVAWSPDSMRVAAAAHNRTVSIWNVGASYSLAFTLSGPKDILTSASWSRDGALLAAGCANHTVTIWNARQAGPALTTLAVHSGMVTSVAWSSDSAMLAAASTDGTIIIWQRQA